MKIICGTGHRPNKLGGYGYSAKLELVDLAMKWLEENDTSLVISGGALGWDYALACAAYNLDRDFAMYLPFPDFDSRWPDKSRHDLKGICEDAVEVRYISPEGYAPWKMQVRNEAMVNAADVVLALWNGKYYGGTFNCVRYAEKVGKPVVNLWTEYERLSE